MFTHFTYWRTRWVPKLFKVWFCSKVPVSSEINSWVWCEIEFGVHVFPHMDYQIFQSLLLTFLSFPHWPSCQISSFYFCIDLFLSPLFYSAGCLSTLGWRHNVTITIQVLQALVPGRVWSNRVAFQEHVG